MERKEPYLGKVNSKDDSLFNELNRALKESENRKLRRKEKAFVTWFKFEVISTLAILAIVAVLILSLFKALPPTQNLSVKKHSETSNSKYSKDEPEQTKCISWDVNEC